MKKFFNLLKGRIVFDRNSRRGSVKVSNSLTSKFMFYAYIVYIDFRKREVCVMKTKKHTQEDLGLRYLSFDNFVTISKMQDGRPHFWITPPDKHIDKPEEE